MRSRATRVVRSQDRRRVTRQCRIGWVSFEIKDGVHVASVQWNPDSDMSGEAPATWTVG